MRGVADKVDGEGMAGISGPGEGVTKLISQKVFIQSFRKSQFPHKFVNMFFILVEFTDKMTNWWGN